MFPFLHTNRYKKGHSGAIRIDSVSEDVIVMLDLLAVHHTRIHDAGPFV